ncbi:TIGR00266 family protein [Priestia filamentosa]|uniref:TIGR00266 family protein n=1 Tax=Priestia filamentosa TaxID=1402861 RepID=UPI003978E642
MENYEIDYKLHGEEMQYVTITLDPKETVVAEAGHLMMMEPGIEMETIFGDGSGKGNSGFFGKIAGAGKRVLTGESLFMTAFTNTADDRKTVSFAAPYPGQIVPFNLKQYDGKIICQKESFLCAAKGVSVGIAFQKKIGTALFGGEGFIMQKLEGNGLTFIHSGGALVKKELQAGETLLIDTGCLVAMTQEVNYSVKVVKNVKTALFGEGLFIATLEGPGTVWLQSLPFSRLAGKIVAAGGGKSSSSGTGSILDILS